MVSMECRRYGIEKNEREGREKRKIRIKQMQENVKHE